MVVGGNGRAAVGIQEYLKKPAIETPEKKKHRHDSWHDGTYDGSVTFKISYSI